MAFKFKLFKKLFSIIWILNNGMNLKCKHCFELKKTIQKGYKCIYEYLTNEKEILI